MEIVIFGRFHAQAGREQAFSEAFRDVILATRKEVGCLEARGCRSIRDPRLFYLHSRWVDQATFDAHAKQPHTVELSLTVQRMLRH
jgi:quinol monooxygenase YgiN